MVGFGEYGVVWLGTDWNWEVEKGVERNKAEAKRQAQRNGNNDVGSHGSGS